MNIDRLLDELFPAGHDVRVNGRFLSGEGTSSTGPVAVIGTTERAPLGVDLALDLAAAVLDVVRTSPGRSILLLVDTEGQRLSKLDELLGINGYMAHLAKCIDLARRSGHLVLGLVYTEAVSGGFLASSLFADRCFALPEAEVRVMDLAAMARITKIPLERLEELSQNSPVFAPGAENFVAMGAIAGIWTGNLADRLVEALAEPAAGDTRRADGLARGGRLLAFPVAERVRRDA